MFGTLSSVLQAAAEATKYHFKNKKPKEYEEHQKRQDEINKAIANGDASAVSVFFERLRRKTDRN